MAVVTEAPERAAASSPKALLESGKAEGNAVALITISATAPSHFLALDL
jgi:hypothetical protein